MNDALNLVTEQWLLWDEVREIARVPHSAGTNWVHRGLIIFSQADELNAQGKRRRYSALDTVRLYVIGELSRVGVGVEAGDRLSQEPLEAVFKHIRAYKNMPLSALPTMFKGHTITIFHDGRRFHLVNGDKNNNDASTFIIVDLHRIAMRVASALEHILDDNEH